MAKKILWVEDDKLLAIEAALKDRKYIVHRAYFLSDAEKLMNENDHYDVVLIDVIMPIEGEDIRLGYTAKETGNGHKAGLAFYRRHRQDFEKMKALVLVCSIVGDEQELKDEFVKEGLPESNFLYKVSMSNVYYLSQHIEQILDKSKKT